jgi:uncharacterized protein (DUF2249 family)
MRRVMEAPAPLRAIDETKVVTCDVRDELRAGREPFSIIMNALRRVPAGGALAVRAIMEPVPLYGVMQRHGLTHWTEQRAADDWLVWFYPGDPEPRELPEDESAAVAEAGAMVVLDVRGLEPPEPMQRTLEALEELPAGATLVQLNSRVPKMLLPLLEARGFSWKSVDGEGVVRTFISRSVVSD